jgi:hypothetical protein
VHHRVASRFRAGRAFLLGDAAHIHSPVGAQGMNTGIGDAVNLAWKLAEVIQGRASEKLLETYEPERIAFARVLVKTTDTAFKLVANRSWPGAIFRAYVLPVAFTILTHVRFGIRYAFRVLSQIRINYRPSLLSEGDVGGAIGGDRLPWVRFGESDNFAPLVSLAWQVHVYGETQGGFAEKVRALGLPMHVFPFTEEAKKKGLLRNGAYVIRPDGYIGLAQPKPEASAIADYLSRFDFKNTSAAL